MRSMGDGIITRVWGGMDPVCSWVDETASSTFLVGWYWDKGPQSDPQTSVVTTRSLEELLPGQLMGPWREGLALNHG